MNRMQTDQRKAEGRCRSDDEARLRLGPPGSLKMREGRFCPRTAQPGMHGASSTRYVKPEWIPRDSRPFSDDHIHSQTLGFLDHQTSMNLATSAKLVRSVAHRVQVCSE